jgi:hypothetical protein
MGDEGKAVGFPADGFAVCAAEKGDLARFLPSAR